MMCRCDQLPQQKVTAFQARVDMVLSNTNGTKARLKEGQATSLARFWAARYKGGADVELGDDELVRPAVGFENIVGPAPRVRVVSSRGSNGSRSNRNSGKSSSGSSNSSSGSSSSSGRSSSSSSSSNPSRGSSSSPPSSGRKSNTSVLLTEPSHIRGGGRKASNRKVPLESGMVIVIRLLPSSPGKRWYVGMIREVLQGEYEGWLDVHEYGDIPTSKQKKTELYYPMYRDPGPPSRDTFKKDNHRIEKGFEAVTTVLCSQSVLAYGDKDHILTKANALTAKALAAVTAHFE